KINGKNVYAKNIISNSNAHQLFTKMINEPDMAAWFQKSWGNARLSTSGFIVFCGIKTTPDKLGMIDYTYFLNSTSDHNKAAQYIKNGDYRNSTIGMCNYSILDKNMAAEGHAVVCISILDNYANWESYEYKSKAYKDRKKEVADILIDRVENKFPGFKENLDIVEIATPKTMERYTNSPRGAIYGWQPNTKQALNKRLKQETPIKNLYLAGAWTFPNGGYSACMRSGIFAAMKIYKSVSKK
ncbi:MAG: hypothetical protein MI922_14710, partial [Bacteroidales bacterium]|nr:hypothetical protein [Bacteroidales bacterium]